MEEVALEAVSVKLLGAYPFARKNEIIIGYHVQARGEIRLNEELAEYRLVRPEQLRPGPRPPGWRCATGCSPGMALPEIVEAICSPTLIFDGSDLKGPPGWPACIGQVSERQLDARPHAFDGAAEVGLDAGDGGLVVGLEAQHHHRGGVGRAGQAEAVGVFDAHAVDGQDALGAFELASALSLSTSAKGSPSFILMLSSGC
jgi:hypothetical protein